MGRRLEPECDRIADVQVADLHPGLLDPLGFCDDVPDGIGKAMNPAGGWNRGSGSRDRHRAILRQITPFCPFATVPGSFYIPRGCTIASTV
jgi:hypothetical protein